MSESAIADGLTLRSEGSPKDEVTFAAVAAGKAGELITSNPQTLEPAVVMGAGNSHAIGDTITALIRGRFSGPAATALVWAAKVRLYWHPTTFLTNVAAGATEIGRAVGPKAAGELWADVELNEVGV